MKKIIALTSGLLACTLASHCALAETASATQDINLIIPIVALLDIGDVSPQFSFQAPQNAGDSMTLSASNNTFSVAVSSNNSQTKLDVKIDQDLTPHGLSLSLDSSTLNGCNGSITLSETNQTYCNIGTQLSNTATMTMNASAAQGIAAYGNYSIEVTYTLTDN